MTYDVFISYRRDKGKFIARNLQLALEQLGLRVFFDMEELTDGKFNEKIYSAIEESKNLIFLMTEGALDRCVNEGDWIRHELEHAMDRGVNLVPVAPTGTPIAFPEGLPEKLAQMRFIEVSELNLEKLFRHSVDVIAARLKDVVFSSDDETKEAEEAFLRQARRFKRNDGRLDEDERNQLDGTARELGISNARKILLLEQVESEFDADGMRPKSWSSVRPAKNKARDRKGRKVEKKNTERKSQEKALPAPVQSNSPHGKPKTGEATASNARTPAKTSKSARNKSQGRKEEKPDRAPMTMLEMTMGLLVSLVACVFAWKLFARGHWVMGVLTLIVLACAHVGIHGGARNPLLAWMIMGILLPVGALLGLGGHWVWSTLCILGSAGFIMVKSNRADAS